MSGIITLSLTLNTEAIQIVARPSMTTMEQIISSPLGNLRLQANEVSLISLEWTGETITRPSENPILKTACTQLSDYFNNKNTGFNIPLSPCGSEFELAVWKSMTQIPYGTTVTYGDIAKSTGRPPRAVGTACGRNPIPIIIPCHRVVGSGGRMVGYSGKGGIETKRWLLVHEGNVLL